MTSFCFSGLFFLMCKFNNLKLRYVCDFAWTIWLALTATVVLKSLLKKKTHSLSSSISPEILTELNREQHMICMLLIFLHRLRCWTNTCFWRPNPWSTWLICQRRITSEKRTSGGFALSACARPCPYISRQSSYCWRITNPTAFFFQINLAGWQKSRSG